MAGDRLGVDARASIEDRLPLRTWVGGLPAAWTILQRQVMGKADRAVNGPYLRRHKVIR